MNFCKITTSYLEPFLYVLKITFILLLFGFVILNESTPVARQIVNAFPQKEAEKFVLEMLVMMLTLGFVMSGIGWMRSASCSSTYHITLISMIIGALLHVLQQYSGVYSVFYNPIKHEWPNTTKTAAIVSTCFFFILMFVYFCMSLCVFKFESLLHFDTFLQSILFAFGTSFPYLLVSYNRKNEIQVKEDSITMILTFFSMISIYYVFEYTKILDLWYTHK
jgi:hypothetical protein